MINQPLHKLTHRLRPSLVVQHPEQAARLPCRHDGALRDIPQHIIIRQVSKRSHICRQTVGKRVQRLDDKPSLTDAEFHQILIQLFKETGIIFTLSWNLSHSRLTRLIREYHSAESTIEELVLVKLAGCKWGRREREIGAQNRITCYAVCRCSQSSGSLAVVDIAQHLRYLLMSATHPVRHLHLGQIEVLRSLAQLLASHGILDEGGVGDI